MARSSCENGMCRVRKPFVVRFEPALVFKLAKFRTRLKAFFNWTLERECLTANLCRSGKGLTREGRPRTFAYTPRREQKTSPFTSQAQLKWSGQHLHALVHVHII